MANAPTNIEKKQKLEKAVHQLLEALEIDVSGPFAQTPQRVAELWSENLVAAQYTDINDIEIALAPAAHPNPVSLVNIGVHLVCPHHLTIAFGKAHVAYEPGEHVTGFGAITRLLEHCTQRLVLQEDATAMAANLLLDKLQARAVCIVMDAQHPCHNVLHARGHDARAITWAHAGAPEASAQLEARLRHELE